jgi:hypothetical protein
LVSAEHKKAPAFVRGLELLPRTKPLSSRASGLALTETVSPWSRVSDFLRAAVFKNLRTSTKLVLLCAAFIVAVGATTYGLVAEKQISITFARKELIGSKFLMTLRALYFSVLTGEVDFVVRVRSCG